MKTFGIIFGVLCVVLVSKCEDPHHINHRVILENESIPDTTILPENPDTNATKAKTVLLNNDAKSEIIPADSVPRNDSTVLEQERNNSLGSSSSSSPPPSPSDTVSANKTVESPTLPQVGANGTVNASPPAKFNVTTLLRTNLSAPVVKNPLDIGVVPNISANVVEAPKIFPNGTSVNGTKIIEGDSEKLHTLISQQNSTTEKNKNETNVEVKDPHAIDTEVPDLLKPEPEVAYNHQHPMEPHEPEQIPDKINDDTEPYENGQNTEDQLRKHKKPNKDHDYDGSQQPYLAAILVSSLVAASVLCYAALLVWRRYLENRYGSRTMLVNEEDFDDPSDMRHFSEKL